MLRQGLHSIGCVYCCNENPEGSRIEDCCEGYEASSMPVVSETMHVVSFVHQNRSFIEISRRKGMILVRLLCDAGAKEGMAEGLTIPRGTTKLLVGNLAI